MIDTAILRADPDALRRSLARRGLDVDVDGLITLEESLRRTRQRTEEIRAAQKELGKIIAGLGGDEREKAIAAAATKAEEHKRMEVEVAELESQFNATWAKVPNLVDASAAEGHTDADAVEVRKVGEPHAFSFPPLDSATLGERLGIIDMGRGAKVSGSRFGYLRGAAVLLEFGLVRFAFDRLIAQGFTPMVTPVLVKEEALYGTGFFPGDREQVYSVAADDLYLIGTSEVALAAYHTDEILNEADLPIRYAGFSSCFRREAGSYGKDTTGLFRVHQFDKVEMFSFCRPEDSPAEHERLLAIEESLMQALEFPYRVVNIAAGDLGSSATKKFDIEAWFPTQSTYREVTSTSNTTDYQSRRLRIRYKSKAGNRLVHTLNGTAVAVGRTILAILENHQQADGSVRIPTALQPYVGFDAIGA
jgi:seryl-tRNA synthetase